MENLRKELIGDLRVIKNHISNGHIAVAHEKLRILIHAINSAQDEVSSVEDNEVKLKPCHCPENYCIRHYIDSSEYYCGDNVTKAV